IREGYFADLVVINPDASETVDTSNILYKCKWSPFEGYTFKSSVDSTFVNGRLVYHKGQFDESEKGKRLTFNR
ncbi:MAG: dihydroorotase, partial [bacterium]